MWFQKYKTAELHFAESRYGDDGSGLENKGLSDKPD